ncbi:MAG: nitrile hydratase subunit beta [Chloroflexi bacterium]|nr:nitrile hydratase subunit beta [Chloroflexota bacterium]
MPQVHDRGGWPTDGPIDRSEHEYLDWERKTHALVEVLREQGVIYTDELRRGIESLPPEQYETLSYYERWSASVELLLLEKNILTKGEIDAKVEKLEESWG